MLKSLFDSLKEDAIAIINRDDKNSKKMGESTKANKLYYSLKTLEIIIARLLNTTLKEH